jgi:hypothetical protein
MNQQPKLRMKYVKTVRADFDAMHATATGSLEVRNTGNTYVHKPLKKQGRFAGKAGR